MRNEFNTQLEVLRQEMSDSSAMAEEAITSAVRAFRDQDTELAAKLPAMLEEMDRQERDVEDHCLKLLMRQQPVAKDLRTISSAMKMITDMERIVCQSADMAEIVMTAKPRPSKEHSALYQEMSHTVKVMVRQSVDAFLKEDAREAIEVIRTDDKADQLFDQIKEQLIQDIRTGNVETEYTVDLLMIAKYLERIGDHAVNISQWVVFIVTGVLPKTHEDDVRLTGVSDGQTPAAPETKESAEH